MTVDRLAGLEARAAITDVLHAYCRCLDSGDIEGLVALFTVDCTVDYGPDATARIESRAHYREWLLAGLGRFVATSHHLSNIEIVLDDLGARAESRIHAWHRYAEDGHTALLWGRYRDRLVRCGDGYLIARRRLEVTAQDGLDGRWHATPPRATPGLS